MSLAENITRSIPSLRRYACALSGSKLNGDTFVKATLQAIVADRKLLDSKFDPVIALFKLFHEIWNSGKVSRRDSFTDASAEGADLQHKLMQLPVKERQVLLLANMEEFSFDEIAEILQIRLVIAIELNKSALAGLNVQTASDFVENKNQPSIAMALK